MVWGGNISTGLSVAADSGFSKPVGYLKHPLVSSVRRFLSVDASQTNNPHTPHCQRQRQCHQPNKDGHVRPETFREQRYHVVARWELPVALWEEEFMESGKKPVETGDGKDTQKTQ
jgi:hypothetical protein